MSTHVYDLVIGNGETIAVGTSPRLRWKISSTERDWVQERAEVELIGPDGVALSAACEGPSSVDVRWPFGAPPVVGGHRIRVRVKSTREGWSLWSDLQSMWVSAGFGASPPPLLCHPSPSRVAAPVLLRTSFDLPEEVVDARLVVAAQGSYDIELNGEPISDHVLAGGWPAFGDRLLVDEHDVTSHLCQSENAVRVWLAGGWFTEAYGHLGNTTRFYGDQPGIAMRITVALASGAVIVIDENSPWEISDAGPLRSSSIYQGEDFDARLLEEAWNEHGPSWVSAARRDVTARFDLRAAPPVRRTETLPVVEWWRTNDGTILLDFGQNHAGRLRMHVRGERGRRLVVRHAEVLEHGRLATRPLRHAAARDTFVLAGDSAGETFEPRFTFHGYRYAEIDGWPGEFDPGAVESEVIGSDLRRIGHFACSDPLVDRLHDNVIWSTRSNFLALPTDCPQRDERLGWTGDIQVFAPTSSFLYDDNAFLQSWLVDLRLEQEARGGRVPVIVPDPIRDILSPAAAWGDAATIVPWTLYERFGDTAVLEHQFESMKAWVDYVWARADAGIWHEAFQFGDWLDPTAPPEAPGQAMTDPDLVATAYLTRSCELTARTAAVLGRREDEELYWSRADTTRQAFLTTFMRTDGLLSSDTPTAYSLALVFDLVTDPAVRARLGDRLADIVRAGGHLIQTGFVGTPIICDALTMAGHAADAEALMFQTQCPSWLYAVTKGATTIWERWDSLLEDGSVNPGEMTSFNHYALGAVADWLHRRVGGLAPAAAGYRIIAVAPVFLSRLDWAESALDTPYGQVATRWERRGDGAIDVSVEVPPNVQANVDLPGWPTSLLVGSGEHRWTVERAADDAGAA